MNKSIPTLFFPDIDSLQDLSDSLRILVVDDEKVIREILADFLTLEGFDVVTAQDGEDAIEQLQNDDFNLVISDLKMPKMGGLQLLDHIRQHHENILTVIMTGFGTVETAIEAMKNGAYDYILKPFKVEEVVHIVHRGMEKQRLISENIRLKEILSIHEFSESLQTTLSKSEVIDSVLNTVMKTLGCDYVGINLRHQRGSGFASHFGKSGDNNTIDADAFQSALDTEKVAAILKEKRYILAQKDDAAAYFDGLSKTIGSFMATALVIRQETIGFINAVSTSAKMHFTEGQRKMMDILGSRSAAAIDNAELYSDLKLSFRQTIQSLARALEAMDTYTAGHSDRVMLYASLTAKELNIDEETTLNIKQAAMLHDIGKLGCHTNLNKPGKLTDEEYKIFKQHPTYGKEILEPIRFMHNIIPGVEHHHERWDGDGYPRGLRGDGIPLAARILAVADSYDAMTSNRAYRKALLHANALTEIKNNAGTQFDPFVAKAFLCGIQKYREKCQKSNISIPE